MAKDIKQLFGEYIDECEFSRGLRSETIKSSKAVFKHFYATMPEITHAELLTREGMNEFFKRIKTRKRLVGKNIKTGLEDSTIKTYGNRLNNFFVWLIERKIIQENPMKDIKLRNPEYKDQRALKDEEIHKIIAAVNLHSKSSLILRRDMMMLYLLLFCGLRKGEFISLRVADIDINKRLLTVRAETSKSKRTRYIPIHPTAMLSLLEYIKERNRHGYKTEKLIVSSNNDQGLTRDGLKHWANRLIKLSGVKFHLHRFRHSFACNLAKNDVGITKIQKLMGHMDPRMTASYLRSVSSEDLREDICRLSI